LTSDLACHSEERRDEESAFDFSVLIERMRKSAKQMLHFIQHDKTANCERPEGFGFPLQPLRLCGKYSDSFGCGSAALCPLG
jgi:hypothetical protein